jgi:hypothetical protein
MTQEMTPEQIQQAQAQAARFDALLTQLITSPSMAQRTAAARELAILAPEKVQPPQTRVVLRVVRTPEGKWWGAIEGGNGVVSQMVTEDIVTMTNVLASGAALALNPLMTDAEHASERARLEALSGG